MSRRAVVTGTIAAVVGAAALTTWLALALGSVSATSVTADSQPIVCRTGHVGTFQAEEGEPTSAALDVSDDIDCDLRFVVTNRGPVAVTMADVSMRALGPASQMGPKAIQLDEGDANFSSVLPATDPNAVDALFTIENGYVIEPGRSVLLLAKIDLSGAGCSSPGVTLTPGDEPTVSISTLGISAQITSPVRSYSFVGTEDTEHCG